MASSVVRRITVFTAAVAAGCSGHVRSPAAATTLTVLSAADERFSSQFYWDMPEMHAVFLPLATENQQGGLEGRLASHWEHSADSRTWTIHLRPDVRWHDGVPVTAHDVKFTWDLWTHPALNGPPPDAAELTVLDDTTYTFTMRAWAAITPVSTWNVTYPKHLLEGLDPAKIQEWEFWKQPVGNGPYRYVRHVPKTMTELEANPDYYAGRPRIDRLILRYAQPNVTEILSGNVDVMPADWNIALRLGDDPGLRVISAVAGAWTEVIAWNTRHALFRDPGVRRALTLGINRAELHGVMNFTRDLPLYDGPLLPRQVRRGAHPAPLPHDPEAARSLLEAAGWSDRDGDGVREQNGMPFRFVLLVGETSPAAVFLQDQYRRLGIQVDIETVSAGIRKRLLAGDFDAAIQRFVYETRGGRGLRVFLGDSSVSGFSHPRLPSLFGTMETTMDPGAREALYAELYDLVREYNPMTVLYPVSDVLVARTRLQGLPQRPWAGLYTYLPDLWIKEGAP